MPVNPGSSEGLNVSDSQNRNVTAALSDPLDSKDQQHLMLAYMVGPSLNR